MWKHGISFVPDFLMDSDSVSLADEKSVKYNQI